MAWTLAALLPLLTAAPLSAADRQAPAVIVLDEQANEIWSALPEDPQDRRLTLVGRPSASCAADALRQAKDALGRGEGGRLALRSLSFAAVAEGQARSDQAVQPLWEPRCGAGVAMYDIRERAERPGQPILRMWVEGGCGCRAPGASGRRRFRVVGEAELEPGTVAAGKGNRAARWRVKDPRYFLLASCGACEGRDEGAAPASKTAQGPCGQLCAPLGEAVAGWGEEAARAAAGAEGLAAKLAGLEVELSAQRQELGAAEAARRKPRSVLERIAALQAKAKATQEELTRISRAVAEAREHLTGLRRAVDEGRAVGDRCQAQCQARPSQAGTEAGQVAKAGGAAGGGGLGTGTIVLGGAGLAGAAAAVAVASRGSNDAAAEPRFEGTWTGTRIISATGVGGVFGPPCVRSFNEVWTIRRTGDALDAHIQTVPGACEPTYCFVCSTAPFDGSMSGTVDGSIARFVVYTGYGCILPLRLERDLLTGNMPPCSTGGPATSAMDVTLRRTGN